MKGEAVFAGEYVAAGWGCGSGGCYTTSLVNRRTGQALETSFTAYNVSIDFDKGIEERVGEDIAAMRVDSRLLVTREATEDEPRHYFTKFWVVDDGKLTLLKSVEVPASSGREIVE
jgi:hypothetical protein